MAILFVCRTVELLLLPRKGRALAGIFFHPKLS